jgi:hypothetical protein
MLSSRFLNAILAAVVAVKGVEALVAPTEIYNGGFASTSASNDTALRIATGGAGQSGLVKGNTSPSPLLHPSFHRLTETAVLADAFIQDSVKNGSQPFTIGWVRPLNPNIPSPQHQLTPPRSSATPPSQSRTSKPAKPT